MEENRMTFGAYLKAYFKQCLEVLKHPKMLLPTVILAVVWIGLGIIQNKVERNLPLSIINFLTFAQGGLYGGIFGAIGGVLGKIVVAAFVNVMIVPLFHKKNPVANLKQGFNDVVKTAKFESTEAFVSLLKGFGAALLFYSLFNVTQSLENSMVGIVSAVALVSAAARKGGFLWGLVLSWMNTVSKGKVPTQQRLMRALTGMTLGFTFGVVLSATGSMWAGSLGIIALVVGWIMGRKSRSETVASVFLILVVLLGTPQPSFALGNLGNIGWVLESVEPDIKSSGSGGFFLSNGTVSNLQVDNPGHLQYDYTTNDREHPSGHATGEFTILKGSYMPGEVVRMGFSGSSEFSALTAFGSWSEMHDSYQGGIEGMQNVFDYTFPDRDDVGSDELEVYFCVHILGAYVAYTYHFVWGGDIDDEVEIEMPGWLDLLFGGEHADDLWSILIGLLGAAGGAAGAGLDGGLGDGGDIPTGEGPTGEGPAPENEPSPEELEWQRYQNELEDRRNRYVRDNPDGTRTVIDPATGNTQTLYPRYNTETGAPDGWVNENDTHYNDESLNDWLAWRERNSDTFAQDAAQAERNLEEQRAMNKAQNDYDRQRGSSATADKWKAEKEKLQKQQARQEHLDDLANKYGLVNPTPQELKRALKKEMLDAHQEGAEAMIDAAKWNDWVNGAEIVEQTADTLINVLGETSPQARLLKNQYTALKAIAKRGMESATRRESVWKGLAHGAAEGVLSVAQNQGYTSVMGEMGKSVLNDLMDPEKKSWKEILDNATKNGVRRFGYDQVGKFVGNLGDKAFGDTVKNIATSNPDAAKQIVQAFEGSKQVTSFAQEMGFHNNAADEIAEYLNLKRQQILGI